VSLLPRLKVEGMRISRVPRGVSPRMSSTGRAVIVKARLLACDDAERERAEAARRTTCHHVSDTCVHCLAAKRNDYRINSSEKMNGDKRPIAVHYRRN